MKRLVIGLLAALLCSLSSAGTPILAYHRIADDLPASENSITRENFVAHMSALRSAGYKTMTMHELAQSYAAGKEPDNTVVLTFDDGYLEHAAAAVTLTAMRMRATFFVITGMTDTKGRLGVGDLRGMIAQGHEIGAHSHTHAGNYTANWKDDGSLVPPPALETVGDAALSRAYLQAWLPDVPLYSYAYPYGAAAKDARYNIGMLGFESAVSITTQLQAAKVSDWPLQRFYMTRMSVSGKMTPDDLLTVVRASLLQTKR